MKLAIDERIAAHPVHHNNIRPAALWSFLDTLALFGAAGWLYVAIIAVFRPAQLSQPFAEAVPVRIDTLGIVCFGLSAVAYLAREIRTQLGWSAVFRTVFVYSAATAIYLTANSVSHPRTMAMPLTHLLDWPSERAALICALVASISSFYVLQVTMRLRRMSEGVSAC
jgi:hypothetical protein